jgi:hypothetical protein
VGAAAPGRAELKAQTLFFSSFSLPTGQDQTKKRQETAAAAAQTPFWVQSRFILTAGSIRRLD